MRVIAGIARGVPLQTPRSDLRPTMDVVKGAIFSSLGDLVVGARVLDLFAGSGALGIEALSRGAASATFVESDHRATAAIERNLEKTRLAGPNAIIQTTDVFRFLDRRVPVDREETSGISASHRFQIIFADPPYAKAAGERDFTPELLGSESLRWMLDPDGIFVLEHLPGKMPKFGAAWECIREKKYGATAVALLRLSNPTGESASNL